MTTPENAIKIFKGTYKNKEGWLDRTRKQTECFTPVIIKRSNGTYKYTAIHHESFCLKSTIKQPTTYEEAMLAQHNDIYEHLHALVDEISWCYGVDVVQMQKIFGDLLKDAKQKKKSKKKGWRRVVWTAGNGKGKRSNSGDNMSVSTTN